MAASSPLSSPALNKDSLESSGQKGMHLSYIRNFVKTLALVSVVSVAGFPDLPAAETGSIPEHLSVLGPEAKTVPEIKEAHDQFVQSWKNKITNPFQSEIVALRQKYTTAIERMMNDARSKGDLEGTLTFKKEIESVNINSQRERLIKDPEIIEEFEG